MIKDQAARHFYSSGYAATDLRRIAAAVGMHVASLYNYISGKEELLYLIMKDGMTEIRSGLNQAMAGSDDPVERLRAAIESHVVHHARRRYLAWTSHVEVRSLKGARLREILRLRNEYEACWMELLEDGRGAGAFAFGDPKLTMYGILAIGQSVSRWYSPTGRRSAEDIGAEMANQVLAGVLTR
ncbi:TetR/AcrR family transcriptional regulator [Actinophytocola sediminis]